MNLDRRALAADLRREVDGEVRFDTASRALYATDASNYRFPPIGVVVPRTVDAVVATHAVCHRHGAPLLPRGCGTSLSGETVNEAVVVDCSKYLTAIGEPDVETRTVTVEPGAINEQVNERTGRVGLIFGPDPSTHAYCTIGGNVGNNSCGVHSVQSQLYGPGPRTSDNVRELEVVTYDGERLRVGPTSEDELAGIVAAGGRRGEIYRGLDELRRRYEALIRERFPSLDELPRRVSGYNLDELLPERGFDVARALVGTEGTCVTVLEATLLLTPALAERALVVVRCADICVAGDHVPWILEHRPVGLEVVDHQLLAALDHADEDGAWLLVEFGADTRTEAEEQARAFCVDARRQGVPDDDLRLFDDREEERRLWAVREAGLAATAFPGDGRDYWPGWEDSAVPPARIGDYLRDLKALYRSHGLRGAMYGHIGQGCIHSRIDFDLRSERGIAVFRRFVEDAADLVVSYGGVLSGEHGDGQARAELLDRVYGTELVEAFRAFKRIWDPDWRMNPGKVVDPYPLDANLKLGAGYAPWRPRVAFAYPEDGGDFAHATVRCVGVGACRKPDGADVMCPSFVATREELHTTRGRARLLFELLEGELVTDGWRSREVEEALDLCLACKGCTNDCPVGVDMPTYKAEFLHHHRRGRLRPRHAYAFGLIDQAARVGSLAPGVTNRFAGSALGKRLAGIAPERDVPRFARTTLQRWWRDRGGTRNPDGHRVVLWPDTFTNRFHPEVGIAAVEAIESAGWQVVLPRGHVCCGRPLYDYGFLVLARRYLRRTLRQLGPELAQGTPVVGIEPSCVAVFKDELPKLLPDEPGAARLAERAHHFAEFFERYELDVPERGGRVLLWGHCHQKATGGMDAERALLARAGVESELLQAGCCGLAGSWGFEAGHYELSQQIGEHGLLPAVRALPAGDLLVADGFSCRTQVEQATGRRPLHVAELLVSERASLSERQA